MVILCLQPATDPEIVNYGFVMLFGCRRLATIAEQIRTTHDDAQSSQ
jgi:hypothetical protein